VIFTAPPGQAYSTDLWAPELAFIEGKWYIYFAADNAPGNNAAHRLFVIQADTADPLGTWSFKGAVYKDSATDKWAIDGAVFSYNGKLYLIWSGAPDNGTAFDSPQSLFIAPMDNPLAVTVPRRLLAAPSETWERTIRPIMEGPEPFIHNGTLSIVYSADASWTAAYKLGLLTLKGTDPLVASAWTKSPTEFTAIKNVDGGVYGPGHNSAPIPSPDGTEFWLVYHAKALEKDGWEDREIALRPFTWNADNTPNLSAPIPDNIPIALPAGEPCGLLSTWSFDADWVDDQGNPATAKGKPTSVAGKYGKALQLDGTSAYLDLNRAILTTTGSYTVSVWVKLASTDQAGTMISQEGGISSEFVLEYTSQKQFAFSLFTPQGQLSAQVVSKAAPTVGEWAHLVAVRDGLAKEIRLYVNGVLQEKRPFNEDWSARGHTVIGVARQKTQHVGFFAGVIDEVTFYNSAFSEVEVQQIK
jgi:GH43 family beta-xylosidase